MNHRQQFITDVINAWIRNHPDDYKKLKKLIKEKRKKLNDVELAKFKYGKGRVSVVIPEGLHTALDMAIDNPRFLIEAKELKWFSKQFPDFLIPYEY